MLCALALAAAGSLPFGPVELEVGGGAAHTLETSRSETDYPSWKPLAQMRIGVGVVEHFFLGASFLGVLGGEARNGVACCGNDTGNQAFFATALLLSLRYVLESTPQVWLEGGLGTGHLISLQTESSFEHPPLRGHAGLCARVAMGLRGRVSENVLIGGELAWIRWSNVEQESQIFNQPPITGLSTSALLLLASVTFSLAP